MLKLLLQEILKRPHGALVLACFAVVFSGTWLYYDFAPGEPPLTIRELWGAALIEFLIIAGGIWAWFNLLKRGGKPENKGGEK